MKCIVAIVNGEGVAGMQGGTMHGRNGGHACMYGIGGGRYWARFYGREGLLGMSRRPRSRQSSSRIEFWPVHEQQLPNCILEAVEEQAAEKGRERKSADAAFTYMDCGDKKYNRRILNSRDKSFALRHLYLIDAMCKVAAVCIFQSSSWQLHHNEPLSYIRSAAMLSSMS